MNLRFAALGTVQVDYNILRTLRDIINCNTENFIASEHLVLNTEHKNQRQHLVIIYFTFKVTGFNESLVFVVLISVYILQSYCEIILGNFTLLKQGTYN